LLRELRAAIGALELGLAFPLYVNVNLTKNTLAAGYAAVQHIA
jgi:hypothetical protein